MNATQNFLDKFPTEQQVQSLVNSFINTRADYAKNTQYRMENYFNCVDDYSWGGICDKAQDESIGRMNMAKSNLKEQMENGKPFIEEYKIHVLADLAGNIISENIVKGRFGDCWIIGDGAGVSFVGCSKKQSTYNKKGFQIMERVYMLEFYFTTKMGKRGLITVGRILEEKLQPVKEMPDYATTYIPSQLYFALQN